MIDGRLQDPPQEKQVNNLLMTAVTKDPASLVKKFTKSSQAHIFVQRMVREAVRDVMLTRQFIRKNTSDVTRPGQHDG